MATKTVSLRKSSYEKLKKLKKEGESFSDVVDRISEEHKQDLKQFSGTFPEIGEVEDQLQKERDKIEARSFEG
jgi:predicted CopG family antitoxin